MLRRRPYCSDARASGLSKAAAIAVPHCMCPSRPSKKYCGRRWTTLARRHAPTGHLTAPALRRLGRSELGVPHTAPGRGGRLGGGRRRGFGDVEVDNNYRVVFWSPPTGDEVRAAFSSIQDVSGFPALGNRRFKECEDERVANSNLRNAKMSVWRIQVSCIFTFSCRSDYATKKDLRLFTGSTDA
ncbi:hypothetical protein ZWY2020_033556 [Hordeum vulgare]|nr:hypothetical protein ZWY2020_033556 [Hordeum vulgare]